MRKDPQQLMEAMYQKGQMLQEAWSNMPGRAVRGYENFKRVNFLEGIEDEWKRHICAILMENQRKWYANMDETTRTTHVGSFEKYVFPLIRAIVNNLVAADLVSVQPLDSPSGMIFYFDVLYGSDKGDVKKGEKMYSAKRGPSSGYHYSDELVENEFLQNGNGGAGAYTGTLAYGPSGLRAGTVEITDGTQVVTDDGKGGLQGGGSGTVNYHTGAYSVTFSSVVGSGTAITGTYQFDLEGSSQVPQVDLSFTSCPVVARPNKLRARWSLEGAQDMKAYHGVQTDVEITAFMANMISKEINFKIVQHLRAVASAGSVAFDKTKPEGISLDDHYKTFLLKIIEAKNLIFDATKRTVTPWMIGGTGCANIVEYMPGYKAFPAPKGSLGIYKAGQLSDGTVFYKDPDFPTNEFLMGHKGTGILDTGYVHAPYIGLYTTEPVTLDDFVTRRGMATRTAQKVVNSDYYVTGTITESSP